MPKSVEVCACGHNLDIAGVCHNVNCPEAQRAATMDASRSTAKATARTRPSAFTAGGRVD
jgi:hypothetical protein